VTREEVETLRVSRRWLAQHVRLDTVGAAFGNVVGSGVEILLRRVQRIERTRGTSDGVGVLLAPADTSAIDRGLLVVCEQALATTLVARCLKRSTPTVPHPSAVGSASLGGALGAILLAAVRRAHAAIAWRVIAAGPARALEADLMRADPALIAISATVVVADEAFLARLVVARRVLERVPLAPLDAARFVAALGPVELSLPIVACATHASVADVASLRSGDVWLPGGWPLQRGASGRLVGSALLAPPASGVGIRVELSEDGRLVLRGAVEAICVPEAEMGEPVGENALIQAVGEVPVVVRVEIGEARMSAREWAALGTGDVVALGRRIGEPVVLRVGGVPVARGDLVEIEGEVGVRIVERVAGTSAPQ
jgi:flagellar motor switch/type III secretory pathway protein FliN